MGQAPNAHCRIQMAFSKIPTFRTLGRFLQSSRAAPRPRIAGVAGLFLALSSAAAPVQAQVDELESLASMPLGSLLDVEVSGASKFTQPLRSAPSSATVITAAEIYALGYRSLSDVLRSIRGLQVNSDRAYAYLGVRGMVAPGDYNTRVLLLIDGNRINDAVYDQAFLGTEFPLDLDLVERVEFIPGPGSAVHGANALFGVVNVVTRRSLGERLAAGSVSAGSGGARSAMAALQTGDIGAPRLLLSATRTLSRGRTLYFPQYDVPGTSDGISAGTDGEVQSRVFLRAEDGAGLSATLIHADRDKGASALPGTVFNSSSTRYQDTQTHASLQWSGRVRPETELTARAYASRYAFVGNYLLDYPPLTLNRDTALASSAGLELRALTTQWAGHKLVAGLELQSTPHRDQANFDLDPQADYLHDRRKGHRVSVFAEDQIEITPKWTLSVGGRYDHTEIGQGVFNPRIGAVWQASPEWVLKYLYGSAFRQPNAFERYYAFPGVGGYKTNPDLQIEHVRAHELAVEYHPSPALKWSAALFSNRVDGLIMQRLDAQDGLLQFANARRFSTQGFEIEAEAALPNQSRLRANYSQQHGGAEGLCSQSASRMGKLTLLLPLPASWVIGISSAAVGQRASAPGFAVADLTLSNDAPWRPWRVAFSVYNVLDRRSSDPSPDAARPGVVPQDRRGVRAKLDLRF